MYRSGRSHPRIKFDFSERALVVADVLLQNRHQRFGLLRAEIDALKVMDFDLGLALLLHGPKDEEKIPDVDSDLNAIGIAFAIVGIIHQLNIGLRRVGHRLISVTIEDRRRKH
jgi:hypothetical protein